MRNLTFIFLLMICCSKAPAQSKADRAAKPSIDSSVLGTWPAVQFPMISNNGLYTLYTISNKPIGGNTLVVQKTDGSWQKEIVVPDAWINGLFSADSKLMIFLNADTLQILHLGENEKKLIPHVSSLKFPESGHGEWLAYQTKAPAAELILLNLLTGEEQRFPAAEDYSFDNSGKALVMRSNTAHTLKWADLSTGTVKDIWHSDSLKVTFHNISAEGGQLVFLTQEPASPEAISIWYYKKGMEQAVMKVNNETPGISQDLMLTGFPRFSRNGRWIFFSLTHKPAPAGTQGGGADVYVWSYRDKIIQPEQRRLLQGEPRSFAAVIGVSDTGARRIENEDELINTFPDMVTGDHVVVNDQESNNRPWWKFAPNPSFYLVSLKDGSRTLLKKESRTLYNFSFSPRGNYLVYYDSQLQQYFSYDLLNRKADNISASIPEGITSRVLNASIRTAVDNVAGWETNEGSFLIYDNFDIWRIDPSGRNQPVCITNGYGAKHKIKLRICEPVDSYEADDTFLLTGYNITNKYNGFFRNASVRKADPELLTMGPYTYYRVESQKDYDVCFDNGLKPVKAHSADYWLIKRQSATEAPNFLITHDFKAFRPLSNLRPQTGYNWLTSELISWKQFDGTIAEGVLYKPENFDRNKKYPIIFNYYRQMSHILYEFPYPDFATSNINIPWFVSNGYLVFVPDISYTDKVPAIRSSYNSVVSAAEYLSTLPFVDSSRMGIQGHSWGGAETNYIITHTNIFAAAAEFAGVSDNISAYLTLVPAKGEEEHYEKYPHAEYSYANGKTLWERKEAYLESNAILNADRITSPLLITHNKQDNQIGYRQGVELYMALRRLGKMSWMLEYNNSGHAVFGEDAKDFTMRLTQFFDHYLKGKPAPVWMTRGVPARLRGAMSGFEPDPAGSCGDDCTVCHPGQKRESRQRLLGR